MVPQYGYIRQNNMNKLFICYQSDTEASILAITDTEAKAQNICDVDGDRYIKIELNKNYGRKDISTDNIAVYNINGQFKTICH